MNFPTHRQHHLGTHLTKGLKPFTIRIRRTGYFKSSIRSIETQEFMSVKYRRRLTWAISFIWVLLVSISRVNIYLDKSIAIFRCCVAERWEGKHIFLMTIKAPEKSHVINDVMSLSASVITFPENFSVQSDWNLFMQNKPKSIKKLCWSRCLNLWLWD